MMGGMNTAVTTQDQDAAPAGKGSRGLFALDQAVAEEVARRSSQFFLVLASEGLPRALEVLRGRDDPQPEPPRRLA